MAAKRPREGVTNSVGENYSWKVPSEAAEGRASGRDTACFNSSWDEDQDVQGNPMNISNLRYRSTNPYGPLVITTKSWRIAYYIIEYWHAISFLGPSRPLHYLELKHAVGRSPSNTLNLALHCKMTKKWIANISVLLEHFPNRQQVGCPQLSKPWDHNHIMTGFILIMSKLTTAGPLGRCGEGLLVITVGPEALPFQN